MLPLAIDHFFIDFPAVRQFFDTADFENVVNPVDGVTYPLICKDLPDYVRPAVEARLCEHWLRGVKINTLFARLSPAGVPVPHQAHTDSTMGQYSLMVYLNRRRDCRGGTSLLRHNQLELDGDPLTIKQQAVWARDTNEPEAWDVVGMCPMAPNRAFIFDARRFHRAEPIGGFGRTNLDARLVLTCFFDEAK